MTARMTPLAFLALLLSAGCAASPEAELVGVWTPDSRKTELPEAIGAFGRKEDIQTLISNSTLKLKADRTFTFSSFQGFEGAWSLDGETITLRPKQNMSGRKLPGTAREIRAKVGADHKTLRLEQETPIGKAIFVLLKSG